jgi:hypothetical protein
MKSWLRRQTKSPQSHAEIREEGQQQQSNRVISAIDRVTTTTGYPFSFPANLSGWNSDFASDPIAWEETFVSHWMQASALIQVNQEMI